MTIALKANALITKAELDVFLQTTLDSDYANLLINSASDRIEKFCNRKFILATYTDEAYDGNGKCDLYLKNFPIVAITAFKEWDSYNNVVSYTFAEHTEYIVYKIEGYIHIRGRLGNGKDIYRVTYSAGYAIADVPYDLKKACADLCSFYNINKDKIGIQSESIGQYSYQLANKTDGFERFGMPPEIGRTLNHYRNQNL